MPFYGPAPSIIPTTCFHSGFSASVGHLNNDFGQFATQPWTDFCDVRFSAPVNIRANEKIQVPVSTPIRWNYQSGVGASEGRTYGAFGGLAREATGNLTNGPGLGAFSKLGESGSDVFPASLVDRDNKGRWNLHTGSGIGATRGAGLTLSYAMTDTGNLALAARSERVRFRLDDTGRAPDGVGEGKVPSGGTTVSNCPRSKSLCRRNQPPRPCYGKNT